MLSIGLEQRRLRKIIQTILDSKISIPDFSLQVIKQYQLISLNKALHLIHFSKNVDELKLAIRRLKFDEHFFLQLLVALKKHNIQTIGTEAMPDIGPYFKTISGSLDFELTKAQKKVIQEIHSDLKFQDL